MELIKDYECTVAYHIGKANVVASVLSRKSSTKESKERMALLRELRGCEAILNIGSVENLTALFQVKATLEEEIVKTQTKDPVLRKLVEEVRCDRRSDYTFRSDGTLIKERRPFFFLYSFFPFFTCRHHQPTEI